MNLFKKKNLTHYYYLKTIEMITSSSFMCNFSLGIFLKDTEGLPSFIENISPIPGSYVNIKTTTTAVRVNE